MNFDTIIQLVCWFAQKSTNFCEYFSEKWRKAEYMVNNGFFQPTMEIWFCYVPGAISQQNRSIFALYRSFDFLGEGAY